MPDASPVWQTAFLVWSFVCIGWMIFRGWQVGLVQSIVSLAGLILGYLAAVAAMSGFPTGLLAWLELPTIVARLLVGIFTGFIIFIVVRIIGSILFTKTAHQKSFIIRLIWGTGGAIIGIIFGILLVLTTLAGIRTAGAYFEGRIEKSAANEEKNPGRLTGAIIKLKRSIEAGDQGKWIQSVDVTPVRVRTRLTNVGRVLADPSAARRLMESDELQPLMSDRAVVALLSDPEINDAAVQGHYLTILTNPKVIEAARDPVVIRKIQTIDWDAAMHDALGSDEKGPQAGINTGQARHVCKTRT